MLDESMFEDIHEIAENSAYLKAVEEKNVSLEMLKQLPPYEELKELEAALKAEGKITFDHIFSEATGFYLLKCFLLADYAVDKAIFIKDVEAYRSMRFDSARRKIAKLLFQRFVAPEGESQTDFKKGASVFQIIQSKKINNPTDEKSEKKEPVISSNGISQVSGASDGMGSQGRLQTQTLPPIQSQSVPSTKDALVSSAAPTQTQPSQQVKDQKTAMTDAEAKEKSMLMMGTNNNTIGVFGPSVKRVRERLDRNECSKDLFDEVAREVMTDLKLDVFPRFLQSEFYRKYIRTKYIETVKVGVKDFTTFRVLGRGGFGAVHACRKKNSGTIYAMKCINKKLVKVKSALDNVVEERNVLTLLKSNFVTNLKYALQDEETLYLIMDLMLGGDLKFHLINAGRFTEKRARFYAAQVLLGLEHLHAANVIYRDMKLENVLLDHNGHCRISDLGLAVVTKEKIKGYAGTPGYTAPEMIKNKPYGPSADIFSYGVMLYRMLCGSKPFKGRVDRDLDKAVIEKKPQFPKEIFSKDAASLLTGLLQKKPEQRLGCGDRGIQEIKDHPFFESIDWGLLESGYLDPPFVPNRFDVNAAPLKDIGDFDRSKYRHVKVDEKFKAKCKGFDFVNVQAVQEEMVSVLEKADENKTFEKFSTPANAAPLTTIQSTGGCCVIL